MPKDIRQNATHYFTIKIPNIRELQQLASDHWSDIEFKDFINLYNGYNKESFSFLVNNITLQSVNPLRYRKNLLQNDC